MANQNTRQIIFIMNHNNRSYYSNTIQEFVIHDFDSIWSKLTAMGRGDLLQTQKQAWVEQIEILKTQLISYKEGYIGSM